MTRYKEIHSTSEETYKIRCGQKGCTRIIYEHEPGAHAKGIIVQCKTCGTKHKINISAPAEAGEAS